MPPAQPDGLLLLAGAALTLRSSNVSAKRGLQLTRGYSSTFKPLKAASTGPSTSAPTSCSDLQSQDNLKRKFHFSVEPFLVDFSPSLNRPSACSAMLHHFSHVTCSSLGGPQPLPNALRRPRLDDTVGACLQLV